MKKLNLKLIISLAICIIVVIAIQVGKKNMVYTTDFVSWAKKHTFATAERKGNNIVITVTSLGGESYEDCEVEVSVEYNYKHYGINTTTRTSSKPVTIKLDESGKGQKPAVDPYDIGVNSEQITGRCSVTPIKGIVKYKK